MDKKQIVNLVESIVARILRNANAEQSGDAMISESEARTLLGVQLRRNATALVAAACQVAVADLLELVVAPPADAPVPVATN